MIRQGDTKDDVIVNVNNAKNKREQFETYFLKTSAAMGTVEFTGLEMIATHAFGQYLAMPSHRVFTIPVVTECIFNP